jgi:5-methylcytosine-specific restriction endonuclease McrA
MEVVAGLRPVEAPPRREVVTAVRAAPPAVLAAPTNATAALNVRATKPNATVPAGWPANLVDANSACSDAHAPTSHEDRERVDPLTADLRRLHLTVPRRLLEKIAAARDALSHSRPDATTDEILEVALDLLLAKAAKARGIVSKPQKNPRPSKNDDHISAHVKREVMKRDGGRCQWVLANGGICGCTRHLQFDHIKPLAQGGLSTVDNVRLLCRAHNLEAARRVFGAAVMDRYTGPAARKRHPRSG